jgi:hypothetical protein
MPFGEPPAKRPRRDCFCRGDDPSYPCLDCLRLSLLGQDYDAKRDGDDPVYFRHEGREFGPVPKSRLAEIFQNWNVKRTTYHNFYQVLGFIPQDEPGPGFGMDACGHLDKGSCCARCAMKHVLQGTCEQIARNTHTAVYTGEENKETVVDELRYIGAVTVATAKCGDVTIGQLLELAALKNYVAVNTLGKMYAVPEDNKGLLRLHELRANSSEENGNIDVFGRSEALAIVTGWDEFLVTEDSDKSMNIASERIIKLVKFAL